MSQSIVQNACQLPVCSMVFSTVYFECNSDCEDVGFISQKWTNISWGKGEKYEGSFTAYSLADVVMW